MVSASAGLQASGALGIQGAAEAAAEVDWTPITGIELEVCGELWVEPKLTFDISGYARAEADLLFTEIELYRESWRLAGFELDLGSRLGLSFPIHYEQGEPFDLSLDDLEFQVPEIDPKATLQRLVDQVV